MFDPHVSLLNGVHRRGTRFSSSSSSWTSSSSSAASSRRAAVGRLCGQDGLLQIQRQYQDPPSAYSTARQQLAHHQPPPPSAEDEQQRHRQRLQQWPRPPDEVCKAVSKRLKQAGSCAEVLQVVQQHVEHFNQINTALAYAQLARHLRFETSSNTQGVLQHPSYAQLQATAVQQATQFNPRQLGMILTSMAWMLGHDPAPANEAAPTKSGPQQHPPPAAASHEVQGPDSQVSCSSMQSGGQCDQQQQQQCLLVGLLARQLHALLDELEPEDTCHCLWALVKLDALDQDLLTAATAHSLSAGWLHRLTAKPLTSFLWVHAHALLKQQQHMLQLAVPVEDTPLGVQHQQQHHASAGVSDDLLRERFVGCVMCEIAQPGFLATWTPQELSMLLWSCAVLGVPLEQQQQQQQVSPLRVQEAEDVVWQRQGAADHAAVLPLSALQHVCQLAKQRVVQFTPQGVTMIVWSMAELLGAANRHAAPSLSPSASPLKATRLPGTAAVAGSAEQALKQQQQYVNYKQYEQTQLSAWTPGLQQAVHGVFASFAGAAAARMEYYKPQEVSNIFAAYTRLQMLPAALQQAVEAYVLSHAHRLNTKDVTDLLLGAAQMSRVKMLSRHHSQEHLDAAAVRAVLHRTIVLLPALNTFQLAAGAWACGKLARQHITDTAGTSLGLFRVKTSRSSPLVEECLATASELLIELDSRLAQQRASATSTTAAAARAEGSVDSWTSSGFDTHKSQYNLQGAAVVQGGLPDIKQAVALAWALVATAGQQQQQQQLQELPAAVLQWLHHHVQHCTDATSLVHAYAVLVRLLHVFVSDSDHMVQRGGTQALISSLGALRKATLSRLMVSLPRMSAAEAVITAWADTRWQVQQRLAAQDTPSLLQRRPAARDLSVLTVVMQHLHDMGQLSKLQAQSVSMLLWSCQVFSWKPRTAVYTQLLAAAQHQLLHISAHHQVVALQALTRAASPTADPEPAVLQDNIGAPQQQVQVQRVQVIQQLVEQLQLRLDKQAQDVSWQLRHPGKGSALSKGDVHLQAASLIQLAAICGDLQQHHHHQCSRQGLQLLQQLVDVWQLMLQLGVVSTRDALLMVWHLADVLPGSPAQTWHKALLQQLKEQQQQQLPVGLSHVLPQLMRHALGQLQKHLSVLDAHPSESGHRLQQQQQCMQLTPSTLIVALKVFAKLHHQPPVQILIPMLQQLHAVLPSLQDKDVSAAVLALSQLGLRACEFTEAATAMLAHRQQQQQQHQLLVPEGRLPPEQQQRQHGLCRKPSEQQMSRSCSLSLLWAVLSSRAAMVAADPTALSGRLEGDKAAPSSRWLVKLAHQAADIGTVQLLQQPHLLLLSQQVWQMLSTLSQYRALQRNMQLASRGVRLPNALLLQQLRAMTWVLLPKTLTGVDRQQALLHMLHADSSQLVTLFHQQLCWGRQTLTPKEGQQVQVQLLQHCTALLPLWLQYQLQKQCQQQLAVEVAKAQVAAKNAAAKVALRLVPSGEVVLLLGPQQSARDCGTGHLFQQLASYTTHPVDKATAAVRASTNACGSSSSRISCAAGSRKGVAVVLQSPHTTLNSTAVALGNTSTRDALLRAEGYTVLSVPLQPWLPTYLLRHEHQLQLQQFEHRPGKQQHLKHQLSQTMRQLTKQRTRLVQQLVQLLQQMTDTP